ncbi:NADH-ubiquinone oxidoreductase chain 2 [Frankliniella fusca]|uniref:NADH-ubiquinone oxidoreductase chain 2 n=1 Tax=Frankliniella fusca TaxID=407009 RepID=A0AAE1GZX4_9NEOP|nr:NADH-ubiquinone oxidoreductase chain 2 [Frankliniella fusca]
MVDVRACAKPQGRGGGKSCLSSSPEQVRCPASLSLPVLLAYCQLLYHLWSARFHRAMPVLSGIFVLKLQDFCAVGVLVDNSKKLNFTYYNINATWLREIMKYYSQSLLKKLY